jgi:hypothetical protein
VRDDDRLVKGSTARADDQPVKAVPLRPSSPAAPDVPLTRPQLSSGERMGMDKKEEPTGEKEEEIKRKGEKEKEKKKGRKK